MDDNNYELRQELQKIFSPALINEQIILELDKLKKSCGHNISVYQFREDFEKEFSENFNCFEYALDFKISSLYKKIRDSLASSYMRGIFCNSCFVKWLVENRKLEPLDPNVTQGMEAIIIYSSFHEGIKHAGIIKDTTNDESHIISKFGTGNVYEHPVYEVPENYGNILEYYKKPVLKEMEDYFKEYLQQLSLNIDGIVNT